MSINNKNNEFYKAKYLKYKTKYLDLKTQIGNGCECNDDNTYYLLTNLEGKNIIQKNLEEDNGAKLSWIKDNIDGYLICKNGDNVAYGTGLKRTHNIRNPDQTQYNKIFTEAPKYNYEKLIKIIKKEGYNNKITLRVPLFGKNCICDSHIII